MSGVKEKWWFNYLGITIGAIFNAISLNMFLVPNKIAAGGISGLATILHHVFYIPVGLTMLLLNVPLFLVSLRVLGRRFGINTLYGAAVLSVAIDVSAHYVPVLTNDLLLAALYGGVLDGIGLGLVFRSKGTTAGTDLAAAIINRFFGISVGQALLFVDFFVIASAGVVFKSPELSLYALIALFVATQIVDLVQEGRSAAKMLLVVTDKHEAIANAIMQEMDRGITFFQAKGGYTKTHKEVIMCAVPHNELSRVKEIVKAHDKHAFIIVSDAHEVLGEGFK